jgi:hypothetical protein
MDSWVQERVDADDATRVEGDQVDGAKPERIGAWVLYVAGEPWLAVCPQRT